MIVKGNFETVHKVDAFQQTVKWQHKSPFNSEKHILKHASQLLHDLRAGISRLFWWRWIISCSSDRWGSVSLAGIMLSCSLTKSAVCPDLPPLLTEQTLLQLDAPNAQQQVRKRAVLVILNWWKMTVCAGLITGVSLRIYVATRIYFQPQREGVTLLKYSLGEENRLFWLHQHQDD